ncbi:DUF1801 domain-containing protein [Carnobacterium funditum]|uniref:DUF1801 domain-containing protein n=1 Tax=Carnobacterium funditum TaxID=2752 RepID=UPI00055275FF|nr:DUF1801 domain-containing protein [Carnobacterium funditum]
MQYEAKDVEDYIRQLPEDRKDPIEKLRQTIIDNLPEGFEETIIYGMIGYVVPHSIYPAGYHVDPKLPLSFIHLASQKNNISLYHSGIYLFPEILEWFQKEYPKHVKTKLDMGKSCIRFKNMNTIPYDLIGELCRKITLEDYLTQNHL